MTLRCAAALAALLICACRSQPSHGVYGQVKEITGAELKHWMADGRALTLIDVREESEWQAGRVASAVHIPRLMLPSRIAGVAPDKNARLVLYCRSGKRSAAAAATLQMLGYTNVFSLRGGFMEYRNP